MARTPDRFPGSREDEELILEPASSDPEVPGAIRNISGEFRLRDNLGVYEPRMGIPGRLIFKLDGGIVYDSNGHTMVKQEP